MKRKTTLFEKILMIIGIALTILGFVMINQVFRASGSIISYNLTMSIFLWLILIILIIVVATFENQKEELGVIIKELNLETKLMREIIKDNLLEIKLMRKDFKELKTIDNDLKSKPKK